MDNDIKQPNNPRNGKMLAGLVLLGVGSILLLQQFIVPLFHRDVELWPLWFICWGVYMGAKSNYRKPVSFGLIVLGVVLLVNNNFDGADHFIWPLAIIAFGLWLILRRHHRYDNDAKDKWDWKQHTTINPDEPVVDYTVSDGIPPVNPNPAGTPPPSADDILDTVSVFGGVKKTILSKNFRGGDIVNIFGGAELDFIQADINGRVVIDITQIFGGTKIIVPSNWQVVSDIAAVFAGIDDKRIKSTATPNSEKVLVLKGVSIFAGVDIRSY